MDRRRIDRRGRRVLTAALVAIAPASSTSCDRPHATASDRVQPIASASTSVSTNPPPLPEPEAENDNATTPSASVSTMLPKPRSTISLEIAVLSSSGPAPTTIGPKLSPFTLVRTHKIPSAKEGDRFREVLPDGSYAEVMVESTFDVSWKGTEMLSSFSVEDRTSGMTLHRAYPYGVATHSLLMARKIATFTLEITWR